MYIVLFLDTLQVNVALLASLEKSVYGKLINPCHSYSYIHYDHRLLAELSIDLFSLHLKQRGMLFLIKKNNQWELVYIYHP